MVRTVDREQEVFGAISHPARRRILDLLTEADRSVNAIAGHFVMTRPAVSQHLRVLRDSGFATVRPDGARRLYAVAPEPLRGVDDWLEQFRRFWTPHLDALATELARGKHERRKQP